MNSEDSPITVIEEDTCWGYLVTAEVGRLITGGQDVPEIFPVNFVVDGPSVVFRTAEGSKLDDIVRTHEAAFEADGWTDEGGWSVVLRGRAGVITDPDELARCTKMGLRPWIPTAKNNWVRIEPDSIVGRAFTFGPEPTA